MTETMIMRTSAIADIMAMIAPPIAEKMAPCDSSLVLPCSSTRYTPRTHHDDADDVLKVVKIVRVEFRWW